MAEEKKHYKLNAIALLLVLAIAYLTFAFATGTLPQPVKDALGLKNSGEVRATNFQNSYSERLIYYQDPVYGFNVSYPIGYAAEDEGFDGPRFRALAIVPGFSSEVLEVYASNSSFSEVDFNDLVKNQTGQVGIEFSGKKSLNGKEVYLLNTRNESEFTDEIIFTRNAFFNCNAPDGSAYSAAIVFVVPEVVAADIELADYVIASFKC